MALPASLKKIDAAAEAWTQRLVKRLKKTRIATRYARIDPIYRMVISWYACFTIGAAIVGFAISRRL